MFCYESQLTYHVYLSHQEFENCLVRKVSHIMSASKILRDLGAIKQTTKIKNTFADTVYSVLVVKEFWQSITKFV